MLEQILPVDAALVEAFDAPVEVELFPEERAVVRRAVDKRRREFTTARYCARAALAKLGVAAAPIVPGVRGEPQWPDGVVGSITHCAGYCAAAVAWKERIASVGIDAEPHEPLPDGVLDAVALPSERAWASSASNAPVHRDRLLFSAKEAVYKAWFPVTRRFLEFGQAELTFDLDSATFSARLLVPGPVVAGRELTELTGRWSVTAGVVLTAVDLSATL